MVIASPSAVRDSGKPESWRLVAQVLGSAQRIIRTKYDHSSQKFSPRKRIPSEPKTLGDFLLLERIEANLSQPELARKAGVSERRIKAWEYDEKLPTQDEWQVLSSILFLKKVPKSLKPSAG